jgi:hypothetical protein
MAAMWAATFPGQPIMWTRCAPADRFGNESKLTIILFTLDESTYSRELAPLAGHYPCLRLGRPGGSTTAPRA